MQNVRTWLAILTIILALIEFPAFAQRVYPASANKDPELLAINLERERLKQDEQNFMLTQMTQSELESQAQTIRRNLEALSMVAADTGTAPQLAYPPKMFQKLRSLESQIEGMKKINEIEMFMLEQNKRLLSIKEDSYERRTNPNYEQDKIKRQNARLIQESEERFKKQIALQNARIIQNGGEQTPASVLPPFNGMLPPASNRCDEEELKLCEMLEKKVSEKNYDIAEINLLATRGLPGAKNLDVDKTLKTLDQWAAWIKRETDRNFYKFQKAPEEYGHSEGYYRMLVMITVLQLDFKVCYNKDPKMRAGPVEVASSDLTFFGNSRDLFIHGMTSGEQQGTCASMPVLYVAIGRRLGYPLKLVECKNHLFVRWEDARERFNIEGTGSGLNCYPDQEYMEWPWPISKEELATGMYMKSLSPKRELAIFLGLRSLCLEQNKREKQRLTANFYAHNLQKKEGVDLDKLRQIMKQSAKSNSVNGVAGSASLHQIFANTNSWREAGYERDAPGKRSIIAIERFNSK